MFEQGKLKGQKLKLSNLLSKPEFKQQYLSPIRTLLEVDQCNLLTRVIEMELTLAELKAKANGMKAMYTLKTAFVKLTNSQSWEKAIEKYPSFASEEQLNRFVGCDLKGGIPTYLQDYCQRARMSCTESSTSPAESVLSFDSKSGLVTVNLVEAKFTEITGHMIKSNQPEFSGFDLSVVLFEPEVS